MSKIALAKWNCSGCLRITAELIAQMENPAQHCRLSILLQGK
jgi:hypothetical protein